MDENNNEEKITTTTETKKVENNSNYCNPACINHPVVRAIFIALLIFLGAFCATYFLIDWHMKSMFNRHFGMFTDPEKFERMAQDEFKKMGDFPRQSQRMPINGPSVIRMEQTKDYYKILINLKAFDNNENNLQVSANGNILTISGRTIRKSKDKEQITEFQQSFMFEDDVKLADLTKETNGSYYIITIPIAHESENDND